MSEMVTFTNRDTGIGEVLIQVASSLTPYHIICPAAATTHVISYTFQQPFLQLQEWTQRCVCLFIGDSWVMQHYLDWFLQSQMTGVAKAITTKESGGYKWWYYSKMSTETNNSCEWIKQKLTLLTKHLLICFWNEMKQPWLQFATCNYYYIQSLKLTWGHLNCLKQFIAWKKNGIAISFQAYYCFFILQRVEVHFYAAKSAKISHQSCQCRSLPIPPATKDFSNGIFDAKISSW